MSVTGSCKATVTLPTDEQILITREFDAPRRHVFEAFTRPELVERWWHAERGEVTACEIDLRVGGRYRYAMVANEGTEVAFHGEYREIVPNERIVSTEVYEGLPEVVLRQERRDGQHGDVHRGERTHDAHHPRPGSQQDRARRDIRVGMENGLQDALDLLEEVAGSLR